MSFSNEERKNLDDNFIGENYLKALSLSSDLKKKLLNLGFEHCLSHNYPTEIGRCCVPTWYSLPESSAFPAIQLFITTYPQGHKYEIKTIEINPMSLNPGTLLSGEEIIEDVEDFFMLVEDQYRSESTVSAKIKQVFEGFLPD